MQPNTLRPTDSVPQRQTVYGLHVDRLDGRMAESRLLGKPPRQSKPAGKPSAKRPDA